MIVTEIDYPLALPKSPHPRTEGVHLSAIIRSIAGRYGILAAEWVEDLSLCDSREIKDIGSILRIMIGLAWEDWFSQTLPEVTYHPGEMELGGIYMTPDGDSVDVIKLHKPVVTTRGDTLSTVWIPKLHEFKTTYKSTKTVGDMRSQWMWLTQCKGYCKAMGTRFARIYVLFLCGDYKFPITPQHRVWDIEFTQEEVDETWEMLVEYKDKQLKLDLEAAEGAAA